jgi:hypothetical protein
MISRLKETRGISLVQDVINIQARSKKTNRVTGCLRNSAGVFFPISSLMIKNAVRRTPIISVGVCITVPPGSLNVTDKGIKKARLYSTNCLYLTTSKISARNEISISTVFKARSIS